MQINDYGVNFICKYETGGKEYYENHYKSGFIWPGESSGPTIGVGIDCAFYKKAELVKMLGPYVTKEQMKRILGAIGKSGESGKFYTKKLSDIKLSWDNAIKIFKEFTLPKFYKLTEEVFPGVAELCENAKTALVSLVFNRGASLAGSRRTEMKNIVPLVKKKDYKGIAKEIRGMKRLWKDNPNSDSDLVDRREDEAKLVESCISQNISK